MASSSMPQQPQHTIRNQMGPSSDLFGHRPGAAMPNMRQASSPQRGFSAVQVLPRWGRGLRHASSILDTIGGEGGSGWQTAARERTAAAAAGGGASPGSEPGTGARAPHLLQPPSGCIAGSRAA